MTSCFTGIRITLAAAPRAPWRGGQGQAANGHANRIPDCECNRRGRGHSRWFPESDDAALRLVFDPHVDLGDIRHTCEQVPLHVRVDHLPCIAIEDAIFKQREVERSDDAAT